MQSAEPDLLAILMRPKNGDYIVVGPHKTCLQCTQNTANHEKYSLPTRELLIWKNFVPLTPDVYHLYPDEIPNGKLPKGITKAYIRTGGECLHCFGNRRRNHPGKSLSDVQNWRKESDDNENEWDTTRGQRARGEERYARVCKSKELVTETTEKEKEKDKVVGFFQPVNKILKNNNAKHLLNATLEEKKAWVLENLGEEIQKDKYGQWGLKVFDEACMDGGYRFEESLSHTIAKKNIENHDNTTQQDVAVAEAREKKRRCWIRPEADRRIRTLHRQRSHHSCKAPLNPDAASRVRRTQKHPAHMKLCRLIACLLGPPAAFLRRGAQGRHRRLSGAVSSNHRRRSERHS